MARRMWAWAAILTMMILCACPLVAAEEAPVGWRVAIPIKGLPERLDKVGSGKTVDLLALADGGFTLSLMPLRVSGGSWVRALLTKGDSYFGLCLLGTRSEFAALETVILDIDLQPEGAVLRFLAQPGDRLLAAMELPVDLAGECRLLPVAQTQGVTVVPVEAPPPDDDPLTQSVYAVPSQLEGPSKLRLHPGAYAVALLVTALVLAALVFGNIYWRRIAALALRAKEIAVALWANIYSRIQALRNREKKPPRVRDSKEKREIPRIETEEPHLPGLRVMDTQGDALVRQITMRTAWETAAEPILEDFSARMNDYFLGRAPLPGGGRFLTVGLRNRDALQQLGGGSVRPLFAPNPRGQIFSLEENTGGLYLHADYFAPPSFVLQSVLRSVCLECVFALEDRHGNPLRLEYVLGYAILGIEPARTARTEAGFIVTEKGRLVIDQC